MVLDGVELMVVGMSSVLAFLALLVLVMELSARVIDRLARRFPSPGPDRTTAGTAPGGEAIRGDEETRIAVALAVAEARRRGRRS